MNERAAWLAWSQVPGLGPILLRRLHAAWGSMAAAWAAPPSDLQPVEGIGPQLLAAIAKARGQTDPAALLERWERQNPQFWTPADPDYPRLLWEIPDPPPLLYYRGTVDPAELDGSVPLVGIVGTRSPTDYGRRWTRRLSALLARAGVRVVSGLADGIDAEAHQACLDAGGRTLAVLGTGLDRVYPPNNRHLYARIVGRGTQPAEGLALSEYPAGTHADRVHFPRRNRIVAGLSRAVLVTEAPLKSGALITARLAADCGREVLALPGSLDNSCAEGCLELIDRGAQVVLGEQHLLDLLGELPALGDGLGDDRRLLRPERDRSGTTRRDRGPALAPATPPAPTPPPPNLDPTVAQVLAAVTAESLPLDAIVARSQLDTGRVSSVLLQLELLGLVVQRPGMRYQRF